MSQENGRIPSFLALAHGTERCGHTTSVFPVRFREYQPAPPPNHPIRGYPLGGWAGERVVRLTQEMLFCNGR